MLVMHTSGRSDLGGRGALHTSLTFVPFSAAQWRSLLLSVSPPTALSTAPVAAALHSRGQATKIKTKQANKQTNKQINKQINKE